MDQKLFCLLPVVAETQVQPLINGVGVSIIQKAIEKKNEILSSSYFLKFQVFKMLRFEKFILLVGVIQR